MTDLTGFGKAIEKLAEPITDIIRRVAGPAADEIGLLLQDRIHVFRAKRAFLLVEKFKRVCEQRGIRPQQIRPNILLPILDAASIEDDEELHTAWANLLTTVADPNSPPAPYRAFVEILKELTPEEARFYNALFDHIDKQIEKWNSLSDAERGGNAHTHPFLLRFTYDLGRIYLEANGRPVPPIDPTQGYTPLPPTMEISVSLENLARLGLLPKNDPEYISDFAVMFAAATRNRTGLTVFPLDVPLGLQPSPPPTD